MTVSGQLIKAAKGRESLADSPLQQSIVQATGAAITSEKNRVVKSLAELAELSQVIYGVFLRMLVKLKKLMQHGIL